MAQQNPSEQERTMAFTAHDVPASDPLIQEESEQTTKKEKKTKDKKPNKIEIFWDMLVGRKKTRKVKAYFYSFFGCILICLILGSFIMYGPWSFVRNTLVTSAMTTFSHKYFAQWFYDEDTIKEIMAINTVSPPSGTTDTNQISTSSSSNKADIKVTDISRNGFKGFMMEIPDPSWVRLGVPQNFGKHGTKLPNIVTDYNAIAGMNAGGFADNNGFGNGGTPVGMVVVDGDIIYNSSNTYHNLIGFNEDNILVIGKYTTSEIKAMNIRDAVEFTPALIINGEPAAISGNGGWGYAPRTAIGQKKDGTVLFLVIDGRSATSAGATMKHLLEIMLEFNAYNAANLDGGSSSVLMHNDVVLNNPSGSDSDGMRFLPNAWLVIDPKDYQLPTDRPPYTTRNE